MSERADFFIRVTLRGGEALIRASEIKHAIEAAAEPGAVLTTWTPTISGTKRVAVAESLQDLCDVGNRVMEVPPPSCVETVPEFDDDDEEDDECEDDDL